MRNILLVFILFIGVISSSCKKDDFEGDENTAITYDKDNFDMFPVLSADDEDLGQDFVFSSTESWIVEVSSSDEYPWVTVNPMKGKAGDGIRLSIFVDKNLAGEERSTIIKIIAGDSSVSITLTQEGCWLRWRVVTLLKSGELEDVLRDNIGDLNVLNTLIVKGAELNKMDFRYIKINLENLVNLNIEQTKTIAIPDSAFMNSNNIRSVRLPNNRLEYIGERSFYNSGLEVIDIPNSVTKIGKYAFGDCDSLNAVNFKETSKLINIFDGAFEGCTGLTSIDIPNSVTEIGGFAFSGCTGLTSIDIPSSVTSLYGFSGCTGLTSINIPDSVIKIGYSAFSGCTGLTSIDIPNSVTEIGGFAFSGCTGLTSIDIPNSVTEIGGFAFEGCTGLTSIYCKAITPPSLNYYTFDNTNNAPIYVPAQSVETYENKGGWSNYAKRIQAIPDVQ